MYNCAQSLPHSRFVVVAIMTLLSIDRSDLIKTIEDDEDVVADDASSDEDDVAQPKKNKAARKAKKDFESGETENYVRASHGKPPFQTFPLSQVRRST